MNEKVSKAYFVNSDVLDGHLKTVEDMYARYFEKGNHKVAARKLRSLGRRPSDGSAATFRNGLFIGVGAVFGIQGTIFATEKLLHHLDPVMRLHTGYVLQL